MAAAATDYFLKATANFATTIGAGGVADGTTTTIPLTSVANLATDTGIELVINRIDADGDETNAYETVRGVISGTNLTATVRGVEGSASGWAAGTIVEQLHTADIQNRMVTGILVNHSQTGALKSGAQIDDTSADHQYLLGVSELTADRTVTLPLLTGSDDFVFEDHIQTMTNKRVTKRVTTITSHATPTVNTDNCDVVTITAQAEAITSMTTNLSGTPTNFQTLIYRIKDNATARAITWGASFEARGVALPTTTVLSKVLTVGFIYDTVTSKFGCVASAQEV